VGSEKPSLVIPEVAIGYDQLGSYVLVVGSDKIVERRSVELGARLDTLQVVRKGLTGEDWVIVNGQMQAVPGRPVTPVREPLTPGPEKIGAMPRANHASKGVS
jgi:multidrug efflux pump subunit AcrA (membrane-fusion protein)